MLKEKIKKENEDEPKLKMKLCPVTITKTEKIIPNNEPAIVKKLPQIFAKLSFFFNTKEPTAPVVKNANNEENPIDDVIISIILFIQDYLILKVYLMFQEFLEDVKGLPWVSEGHPEYENQ